MRHLLISHIFQPGKSKEPGKIAATVKSEKIGSSIDGLCGRCPKKSPREVSHHRISLADTGRCLTAETGSLWHFLSMEARISVFQNFVNKSVFVWAGEGGALAHFYFFGSNLRLFRLKFGNFLKCWFANAYALRLAVNRLVSDSFSVKFRNSKIATDVSRVWANM